LLMGKRHKLRLKVLATITFTLLSINVDQAYAQDSITVYPSRTLNDTARRPLGVNTNYLVDDDANRVAARSTAAALAEMGVKFLRYPGGEKSDAYLWSVPPFLASRPTLARTGPGEWPSRDRNLVADDYKTFRIDPLNFDEFIALCRQIGAEPVVVICYDSMYKPAAVGGTAPTRQQLLDTAMEWVRYANVTRRYNVKYWEIGNESYLSSYNGSATATTYANDLIEFSMLMKGIDPTIKIGANGGSSAWWQTILERASAHIDFLAVHSYPCWNWSSYDYYRVNNPNLAGEARAAMSAIDSYAPPGDRDRIKVAVTETNSADWSGSWPHINNLGHAIVSFDILGQHLQLPRVEFTQVWNTRWINHSTSVLPELWDSLDGFNRLNASGQAVAIWGQFLLNRMVQATGTAVVKAYASYSPTTQKLNIFLINKEYSPRTAAVSLQDYGAIGSVQRCVLKGSGPEDLRPTWSQLSQPSAVGNRITLPLDPISITVLSVEPPRDSEVVLYAPEAEVRVGNWVVEADSTAASGRRMRLPDAGVPRPSTALANPSNYFEMTFAAQAGVGYRLWMRGKADSNSTNNDSVWVQFSDSVDSSGAATYRISTTSATMLNLEDCTGCRLSGWGWNDNAFGGMGPLIYFATSGTHTIRVQLREDGLAIDQVVLSPQTYLSSSPGAAKNDTTILAENGGSASPTDVVLWAADVASTTINGNWQRLADSSAAGGATLRYADAGGAKIGPLASPAHYFEMTFAAQAGVGYRLWMRGKADSNSTNNDSVWVQFSDSVDSSGAATYRISTTSATMLNLEDCTGCRLSGWGWNDNAFGGMGPLIYFATSGTHTIRVQLREDGLAIDQVVLSPQTYLSSSPGAAKNDTTILTKSGGR
jgi:alpha-N-arabinofuranosidase